MTTTIFTGGSIVPGFSAPESDGAGLGPATPASGDGDTSVTALAVKDRRIVALGDDALAMAGSPDSEIVDLRGGVLAPAFGDGHAHPVQGGFEKLGPDVRSCGSIAEIVGSVRAWAAAHPDAEWIYGGSYEATLAPEGLFDARWLDEACADRPVVLRAWDYHTVWVNSEALRRAGIDSSTPEPVLGRIPRRDDGSPLGTLQEPGAVDLLVPVEPGRTTAERVEALRIATELYARLGFGWIQDAWVEPADVEGYLAAARAGVLSTRVNLALRADPVGWRDQLASFPVSRDRVEELGEELLTADTVKVFVDGVIENHTAAMLEDYTDTPGDRGMPYWRSDELVEAAIGFDRLGFQLHFHAIGDAAVRTALDVFEAVERANGQRDRRPVIAHVQVVTDHDRPRFAQLGAVANFEPLWAQLDPMMVALTLPRIGAARADLQYPIATVAAEGARVSFGSDWPVSDNDWRPGASTAVTRQTADAVPQGGWLPHERISLRAALTAYTEGVAWQAFAEDRRGRLRVGSDADLVWLDRDPAGLDARDLGSVRVLGTWVAGRRRFTAELDDPVAH